MPDEAVELTSSGVRPGGRLRLLPYLIAVAVAGDQSGGSAHHYRFHGDAHTLLSASLLYSRVMPQTPPDPAA